MCRTSRILIFTFPFGSHRDVMFLRLVSLYWCFNCKLTFSILNFYLLYVILLYIFTVVFFFLFCECVQICLFSLSTLPHFDLCNKLGIPVML